MSIRSAVLCATSVGVASIAWAVSSPSPVSSDPNVAEPTVLATLNRGEASVSMDVRFGSVPSAGSPTSLFPLALSADGRVRLTVKSAPDALEGDFVLHSREAVDPDAWHHIAFNYSLIRSRTTLYVDGHLVYENDNTYLPKLGFGGVDTATFGGEVKNFRAWDVALESERILPSDQPGKSLWDVRSERNVAALRARVDAEAVKHPHAVKTDSLVAYTTDPMSQEMVLPDAIPAEADFSGRIGVVAAKGEFEAASLVVMALKPVRSFTVRISDLKGPKATIPSGDVSIRLVKRWYRTGGAWVSYFCDYRHRVLTPHLLINDDALIKVDEIATRNYFRLDYPEGTRYVDVSDPSALPENVAANVPFNDAKTLQPIENLTEFGRNQQYWILFHAPQDPGLYRGTLELVADGKTAAKMPVALRVNDIDLPLRGASYDDLNRPYLGQLNIQGRLTRGRTYDERVGSTLAELKSIREHGMLETAGIWNRSPATTELVRKAGFPDDIIFDGLGNERFRWQKLFKKPCEELTSADRDLSLRILRRLLTERNGYWAENFPHASKWTLLYSECHSYQGLNIMQQDHAAILRDLGWKVFAHAMSDRNWYFAGDVQDATFQSSIDRVDAERWHKAGGWFGDYAKPFAAPENPALHRRMLGIHRYKFCHFDGHMQHGILDEHVNQFAPDPGGDGNYRCQIMLYPQQAGVIETICWEGVREAYDDVRYLTKLQQLAAPHLSDDREPLRREARRAMMWMEDIRGNDDDMNAIRLGCIDRILTLQSLLATAK